MKKRCNLVSHINNVLLGVLGEVGGGGVHPFPLSAYIPTTDMPCPARGGSFDLISPFSTNLSDGIIT